MSTKTSLALVLLIGQVRGSGGVGQTPVMGQFRPRISPIQGRYTLKPLTGDILATRELLTGDLPPWIKRMPYNECTNLIQRLYEMGSFYALLCNSIHFNKKTKTTPKSAVERLIKDDVLITYMQRFNHIDATL